MNAGFIEFLALPERDQAEIFDTIAEDLGTLGSYVEKDFWVCLVLDHLFNGLSEDHPALSFKGGTSLSKVFGLIKRFSEDIDITVSREALGFVGDRDPTSHCLSKNQRNRLLDELQNAVSGYVHNGLSPSFQELADNPGVDIQVEADTADPDNATLLVTYRKLMAEGSPEYIRPHVKIEMGARAAQDPCTEGQIVPFISRAELPMDLSFGGINTITAERTFWEKVLILHGWQCRFRDNGKSVQDRNRAARHYYDVALISETGAGKRAVADLNLLERVREHNKLIFPSAWKKYDEACPGTIRIAPEGQLCSDIERDYMAMQDMVLGESPDFGRIIANLKALEDRLNQ